MTKLRVEVVFARAHVQNLKVLELEPGTTAREAARLSGLVAGHDTLESAGIRLGIDGKKVPPGRVLANGDRVEVLRPLAIDPKEARRRRVRRRR